MLGFLFMLTCILCHVNMLVLTTCKLTPVNLGPSHSFYHTDNASRPVWARPLAVLEVGQGGDWEGGEARATPGTAAQRGGRGAVTGGSSPLPLRARGGARPPGVSYFLLKKNKIQCYIRKERGGDSSRTR